MFKRLVLLISSCFSMPILFGQNKWNLHRCIEHALANNISVRQADLQSRFAELTYKQSKASQLPSFNFGGSMGLSFGRSENPTTGVHENNNYLHAGMQLQSQVAIFNWFNKKNTIEGDRLGLESDNEEAKKVRDDIAFNVVVAYLQILLANEQAKLSRIKVRQSIAQLDNARRKVNAGILPEINAADLEAQVIRDSSTLIATEGSVRQFILQMKALLNIDASSGFELETPLVEGIPVEPLADLQPDAVYVSAIANLPQQQVNVLRLQSAKRFADAAKGRMYPVISAVGSLNTNYVNIKMMQYQSKLNSPTGAYVTVGGTNYDVFATSLIIVGRKGIPLAQQVRNNFGQSLAISLNVPIFNGRGARTAWEKSKLTVKQLELIKELDEQQLKQNIYKAYDDAMTSHHRFNADKKAVEISTKAYTYAQKRYELNLLSTYDLITSQNNLQAARIQALYSQFDYIFKVKLLEFYKGQGLKL